MNKWLIIGSTAAYHWYPDLRKPKDIDVITPGKYINASGDQPVIDTQWHELAERIISRSADPVFADPSLLYTLKVSHAYWNRKFDQTLFDIKCFQDRGAVLYQDLHDALIPIWTRAHPPKKLNMNMGAKDFFNDAVVRIYDHEELHELLAFYDRPLHEKLRPDMSLVKCSKERFEALSFDDQIKVALEEILVTAIERWRLTQNSSTSDKLKAVKLAHCKLCTTMAKGWFAQFNVVNHFEILFARRNLWMPQLNKTLSNLHVLTCTNS